MGHGHHHAPPSGTRIRLALALNVSFTVVELVGAWLTNSTAIAADAVHDLGDSVALGMAWGMERAADRGPTARYSFGLRRLSLLSAVINALVLLGGGLIVLSEAVPRLWSPETPDAAGMFGLALLGLAVNGLAAWRTQAGRTMNERVVSWHLIEDTLGWAVVLVVSGVMLWREVPILDPLLAVGLTLFVGVNAWRQLRGSIDLFLQAVPADVPLDEVEAALLAVDGVRGVQHLHVWSQDGEQHVLTGRLDVDAGWTVAEACGAREAAKRALGELGIGHVTLELHPEGAPGDAPCGSRHDHDHDHDHDHEHPVPAR